MSFNTSDAASLGSTSPGAWGHPEQGSLISQPRDDASRVLALPKERTLSFAAHILADSNLDSSANASLEGSRFGLASEAPELNSFTTSEFGPFAISASLTRREFSSQGLVSARSPFGSISGSATPSQEEDVGLTYFCDEEDAELEGIQLETEAKNKSFELGSFTRGKLTKEERRDIKKCASLRAERSNMWTPAPLTLATQFSGSCNIFNPVPEDVDPSETDAKRNFDMTDPKEEDTFETTSLFTVVRDQAQAKRPNSRQDDSHRGRFCPSVLGSSMSPSESRRSLLTPAYTPVRLTSPEGDGDTKLEN